MYDKDGKALKRKTELMLYFKNGDRVHCEFIKDYSNNVFEARNYGDKKNTLYSRSDIEYFEYIIGDEEFENWETGYINLPDDFETPKLDMVNHPQHYQSESGLEVIDVIEAFTQDLVGSQAFLTANVIKYICRWNNKNGLEDLKKAEWYLQRLINKIESTEKEND